MRLSLGTDSQTQIDILEDARELEYHLRLQKLERAVLASSPIEEATAADDDPDSNGLSALAARLFDCATTGGANSIGATRGGGALAVGSPADFFTVALNDLSFAGACEADLLPSIVFSLARTAVRDVVVGGRRIITDGQHRTGDEIIERFTNLQRGLWQ